MEADSFTQAQLFPFEANMNENKVKILIEENLQVPLCISAVYVVVIFILQYYMKARPAFDLRPALAWWSASLAAFSCFGTARCLPDLFHIIKTRGWEASVCDASFFHGTTKLWAVLFVLSKPAELVDTLFIVLRKQKLIFLHWYHHITAMLLAWYSYGGFIAASGWFASMNYSVHSLMYTYYTLRVLKFRIPKWVAMIITTLQIIQMMIAIGINVISSWVLNRGDPCETTYFYIQFSFLVYLSYFILFCHFFYTSYLGTKSYPQDIQTKKST